ncbi:hypothetical protein N0V82_000204 [Gnomoniopsis sp. IMI 355080]|nr:hypothetical protein N0V82_000204 [Gnomoniopsis sp. IMI 355080]
MEVQSTIPAKRGPEDDVQFVSVHPVKKARGSRESSPAQNQQVSEKNIAHPQAQKQGAQTDDTRLNNTDAALESQPGPSSTSDQHVSFPGLENYVFPPPPDLKPSRTSHSSLVLSPRQLPQPTLPKQSQTTMQTTQGLQGFMQPPQFQVPWGMSGLYPQAAPVNPDGPLSRPTPLPSLQHQYAGANTIMDIDDQPLSMSMALRKGEPPKLGQCGQVPDAVLSSPSKPDEQDRTARAPSHQADHCQTSTLPYPSPRQEPQSRAQTPSHTQTRPPTPTATQNRAPSPANIVSNNTSTVTGTEGLASQQTLPPKGPCVVCEQMRQQILFNQANGLPIAHLAQLSHGWHGQSPVAQALTGRPNTGFSLVPNLVQNLQQRLQPIPLGHLPLSYGMQSIPVQVQMQLQRQITTPNVNGNEHSQGISPQNQQNQQAHGQQPPGQVTSQLAPGQPPQYMYSQLPSLPQSGMMQRPIMMHQQPLAPPPPPSSPQPSPQPIPTNQGPALPEPKKHSPNLIVDIAETCEELFPYEEVAKRHGVTRVKVVETFGAIIQLPLLRCTTDKKRHGKLATSRLREYTKAKKDMEATSAASAAKTTPAVSTPPTPASPVAQNQEAQAQANQVTGTQTQNQTRQMQAMQTQAMQAQAIQAQAMQSQALQAQVNQMYATQGNINHSQPPPPPPQPGQVNPSQDRSALPGVFEMTNTISPLGLPSNLTNGLSGHWQQQ